MIPVSQNEFGSTGNCMSACLASIFEVPLGEVPNFFTVGGTEPDKWWKTCRDWLRTKGFGVMSLAVDSNILSMYEGIFIVSGKSNRGFEHAVVFKDGKIIHDPHPSLDGIDEVVSVDMLYPLDPSKFVLTTTKI